ncbi:type II toxin-antitoxin system RelE/ParE family toxin [Marinobacter hydrocarbonoclasticus]|uniref:type II toxin-antitoxin system RelE/ParE family toxin n=1 Tax=Marinobacter nauticus TaxID=2743 RepID=UPI001A8C2BCC|nr:type II toxin-antitoxin system RelE/ParE family toxin [Marinobacter nauticus]MBN8238938.1 type II toxin-antitoxin system RelE/ParE family toxin [Marinobacter nauticus]
MKPWKVILTDAALADLDDILETTHQEFGTLQLKRYTEQIEQAIRELQEAGNLAPLLKHRLICSEPYKRSHENKSILASRAF